MAGSHGYFTLALVRSAPVMCSYFLMAVAYGISMAESGFAWYWSVIASFTIYGGALLYVLVSFLAAEAPFGAVALTALLISSRQFLYSLTLFDDINRAKPLRRLYLIHSLTDEVYALDCGLDLSPGEKTATMFSIALLCQASWLTGAAVGGLAGKMLPVDFTGVDFCMTALFVTIFVDQWEKAKSHAPVLIGLVSGVACLALIGPDNFIMPAMLTASAALFLLDRRRNA